MIMVLIPLLQLMAGADFMNADELKIKNISLNNIDKIPPITYGKVIQNYDENHPNKVKVKLRNSMSADNNEVWADVLYSYAGDGYGKFNMPEIDSEVIVAFIMNNRCCPIVLGNVYTSEKMPVSDAVDKDNYIKSFLTKGGNKITINDKKDETDISVSTAGGILFSFNDKDNMAVISDKDENNKFQIDFKNKIISIDAGSELSVKIDSQETLKVNKDSVSITTKNFSVKADSKISLSGGQFSADGSAVSISSNGNVNIKANGNLSAEATAMAKVKGSLLNLN